MGKGRSAEACQCSELPPHDPRPAVGPVKGWIGTSQVGKSQAPFRRSVAWPGGAFEVRPCFNQRHLQPVSGSWMNALFSNFWQPEWARKNQPR